ncbi:putative exported protein [Plasmodium reichenowi]|uniref:Putative exported protein n=1 Tax=Plasmodium reichenowi TaxID=5854 RepID=A0A151L647_PLARE|nr:putative exported protein [Plasmodium reichenowi]KYN94430.1 putative exported protein [Plasmodium reichenowi]
MNIIYFNILFFALFLDTFISSHTNIPRTHNNNSKNATIKKTPVDTIPDVITLEYIREQLKQIQLIKDEIIKDKLKKIKFFKKKNKSKNDQDLKKDIEKLETEILDTKILCDDYIKNELKEISLIKDEIVKDKIEKDQWKKNKLIDYELNRLFHEAKKKELQQLYDKYLNEQLENRKLQKHKVKKKKRKHRRKTFFELWSAFYELLEEKVHKYNIGGYTIVMGLLGAIGKSIHSIYTTCTACEVANAKVISCFISGFSKSACITAPGATPNVSGCIKATLCSNALSKATACAAGSASIEVSSIVIAVIIIIVCLIALIGLICFLVENKESILENKYVQKIMPYIEKIINSKYVSRTITGLNDFYLSKQLIYII